MLKKKPPQADTLDSVKNESAQPKDAPPDGSALNNSNPKATPQGPNKAPNKPQPGVQLIHQIIWLLCVMVILYTFIDQRSATETQFVPYSTFKQAIREDQVDEVTIQKELITGHYADSQTDNTAATDTDQTKAKLGFKTYMPTFGDPHLLEELEAKNVVVNVKSSSSPFWISVLINLLPWILIIGFFVYSSKVMRNTMGERFGGFGGSKARRIGAEEVKTRFTDVAGLENAKADLVEIISYLKEPEQFRKLGANMPKGILMMGPPGCGKTLLARAVAGEAGVPFFSVSGSEFVEMFVGVGASRVRSMFEEARKHAPAVIFVDEIDAVGRTRGTGLGGGNDEREQTLNQILSEMDGFSREEPIVVVAATNRPDVLDPALLRPGRFDRKLVLELPQRKARQEILAVHTRKTPLAEDVDLEVIAAGTVGFSGADLANLVNEAAIAAVRKGREKLLAEDFETARDKIVLGAVSRELINESEKKRIAYHESGHALTAWLLPNADPIKKISIIPHGRALGYTEQLPEEDRHNYTESYLLARIEIMLGGRCAEKIVFHEVSSGAADDLKAATHMARLMVTQWGMNESLGPVAYIEEEEHPFLGREIAIPKKFSEHSAQLIDDEVRKLIAQCQAKCLDLMEKNRQKLDRLAQALLERESLTDTDIAQLFVAENVSSTTSTAKTQPIEL